MRSSFVSLCSASYGGARGRVYAGVRIECVAGSLSALLACSPLQSVSSRLRVGVSFLADPLVHRFGANERAVDFTSVYLFLSLFCY